MTPELDSFENSLAGLDVASVRVSPPDLGAAIEDLVVGEAVGIAASEWADHRPEAVAWDPTPAALRAAETGVTGAGLGIAEYGSLVLPTATPAAELVSLYVDRHVAVLEASNVVSSMEQAIDRVASAVPEGYSDAIIATGPSATADMGALVTGAHGPREVRVVILEE